MTINVSARVDTSNRKYGASARRIKPALIVIVAFLLVFASVRTAHAFTIVAFGDSLTYGYKLPRDKSFPAQLQTLMHAKGYDWITIVNAGVNGDTTAGGVSRMKWIMKHKPDMVILELGGNDALRSIEPQVTYDNLDKILTFLREQGVPVLLAGMKAPRNLGDKYVKYFDSIYPTLSKRHRVPLFPFFLEGVAMNPNLNQADGIHPTEEGIAIVASNIMPYVEKAIKLYYYPR